MKITIAPEAVADWADAIEYVRERNPAAATRLHERIHRAIANLAAMEFEGAEVVLRRGGASVRSWPVPPYRVFYRRDGAELIVLRVYHGARRPIVRSG